MGTHELLGDILDQGTLHASIAKAPVPYFLKRYAIETCTMAHEEGILAEPIDKNERLRELPSCFDICAMRQPGQPIDITRDLSGIPAVMIQIHTSTTLFKILNLFFELDMILDFFIVRHVFFSQRRQN